MTGTINIQNRSKRITEIDIEGIIGVPEEWQFENNALKVATYEKFKKQLDTIKEISSAEVVVNIRSTGGNVNDAILIHDTLAALGKTVTTRCYGYVASAATIIAQAASTGKREISKNALYLIHKSVSATEGNSDSLGQTVELLAKTDERIAEIYAARSGMPVEDFTGLMGCNNGSGKWLNAVEAIEAGLADRLIGKSPVMNIKKGWDRLMGILLGEAGEEGFGMPAADEPELLPQNKTVSIQDDPLRRQAAATLTEPKEDPSYDDARMNENARAYYEDIQRFK